MAEAITKLPDDTANTGPKIRQNQRTVGANSVREHHYIQTLHETAALANVAASGSNVTIQAANQSRVALYIFNDSADSELYVKAGATASVTSFTDKIPPGVGKLFPVFWAGIVDGIWVNPSGGAVSGTARVTEISP